MKIAKLSLAALLAAGLAHATSLEEAIQGTEVEGFVYVKEVWNLDGQNSDTGNYSYRVHAAVPVNDVVVAHIGIDNTDDNETLNVEQAALTYTGIENVKITVGEHPIMSEFTDTERGLDGSWGIQNGFGITASTTVGGVNLVAAFFGSDNDTESNETGTSESLQYIHADANIADLFDLSIGYLNTDGGESYGNVALDSVISAGDDLDINIGAALNVREPDDSAQNSNTLVTAYAGATIAGLDVEVAYAQTGNNGGSVNLGGDNSRADNAFYLQDINIDGRADTDAWRFTVGADVADNIRVSAGYLMGEDDNNNDITEGKIAVDYNWSENFMGQAFVSSYKDETVVVTGNVDSGTNLKVELRYNF